MIQPQELRIGNHVFDIDGDIMQIGDILDFGVKFKNTSLGSIYEKINPIPLTEEILLKFGFNKEYQKGYIGIDVCNSDFVLTEPLKMGEWQTKYTFQFKTGSVHKFKEIEYVHQLQNLYFALTGEELQLK